MGPVDPINHELSFKNLLDTSLFHTFLRSPSIIRKNNTPVQLTSGCNALNVQSQSNSSSCTSGAIAGEILRFPTAPRNIREKALRLTVEEFHLNIDQEEVLYRVAQWFVPMDEIDSNDVSIINSVNRYNSDKNDRSDDDNSGDKYLRCDNKINSNIENSDIILVHGVFGSGKSHLLASVCVLIKRLSDYCSTTSSSTTSSSSTSSSYKFATTTQKQLIGIKRSHIAGNTSSSSPSSHTGVKCLLSANTNVAVDRIMVQLAKRMNTNINNNNNIQLGQNFNENIDDCIHREKTKDFYDVIPNIARVGCIAKIDKSLRKHLVLQAENRVNALRELTRLSKTDNDPQLIKLANDTKKSDFSQNQMRMILDADVIGVTCASAVNVLLKSIRCHILILDESSQMTEPLSLLPIACGQPLKDKDMASDRLQQYVYC